MTSGSEPDLPPLDDVTASTPEDESIEVVLGPEQLLYTIVVQPTNGQVTPPVGSRTTYTPPPDFAGVATFTFRASDGTRESNLATAIVSVAPVNDPPVARDGAMTLEEDAAPVAIDLGALVDDVETPDADLRYEIVSPPGKGTLAGDGPIVTFDPVENANGTDEFTFRVVDRGDPDRCTSGNCDAPATSAARAVRLTIRPVNDPPTVTLASPGPIDEGGAPAELAAVGADVDGDSLTYTWSTNRGSIAGVGAQATLSADDGPATAAIRVQIVDGNGGTAAATTTVEIRNVAPTADAGPQLAGPWGLPLTLHGTINDPSAADRAAGLSPHWSFGDGGEGHGATATHVYADPGSYTATLAASDKDGGTATDRTAVAIARRGTTLAFTGTTSSYLGETVLAAQVADAIDAATARLAGRKIAFTISGRTYIALTDATGLARVAPEPLVTGGLLRIAFAGDEHYEPGAVDVELNVDYHFAGTGAFAVGPSAAIGSTVTFWSSQWSKLNGATTPSSFKGYVASLESPSCGATWTTRPGNSTAPPPSITPYMAVVVPTAVSKQGATISGDVAHILVVRVDPGYGAAPGDEGTGTVVAKVC